MKRMFFLVAAVLTTAVALPALAADFSTMGADGGPLRVIYIGAHPDDGEWHGGGSAVLWSRGGAEVKIVAVTNGDAGHQSEGGGALARRRAAESMRSARILGVEWQTLGFHDGELTPSLEARKAVIRAIRDWRADIVVSHRPNDYHPDHRYTGRIVQDAAYMVAVPNICPETPRLENNPVFMYFRDGFQKPYPFTPDVVVDVTPVMDYKWRSLDAMESQMHEWGPWLGGYLDRVPREPHARLEFLRERMQDYFRSWGDGFEELTAGRYGREDAAKAEFVELFEVCEYGSQPDRERLWELFPR